MRQKCTHPKLSIRLEPMPKSAILNVAGDVERGASMSPQACRSRSRGTAQAAVHRRPANADLVRIGTASHSSTGKCGGSVSLCHHLLRYGKISAPAHAMSTRRPIVSGNLTLASVSRLTPAAAHSRKADARRDRSDASGPQTLFPQPEMEVLCEKS